MPEFKLDQQFEVHRNKPLEDFLLAKERLGLTTKPVIVGPLTLLALSSVASKELSLGEKIEAFLPGLLAAYEKVIISLVEAGAQYIQIDEPIFATSLTEASSAHEAFKISSSRLHAAVKKKFSKNSARLVFATYFNSIEATNNLPIVASLPGDSIIHVDLSASENRGLYREQLTSVLAHLPSTASISLGLIDGRNIWVTSLADALPIIDQTIAAIGVSRIFLSSSCSLLHVPYRLDDEVKYAAKVQDPVRNEVLSWLSFGIEKVRSIVLLGTLAKSRSGKFSSLEAAQVIAANEALAKNAAILDSRKRSPLLADEKVKSRVKEIHANGVASLFRKEAYGERIVSQQKVLGLPPIPTTTIGSFPQSAEVRSKRAKYRAGRETELEYEAFIKEQTRICVKKQEEIGLDVLVHGEFERTDMVEFFAEKLQGFLATQNGWVQSYGTRCVKPGILFGDVCRTDSKFSASGAVNSPFGALEASLESGKTKTEDMTVDLTVYAQSLTSKPMKGMLTGPTTILQWSFIRDDQSYRTTNEQVALAIRDEVVALERAGIRVVQVDEPGFREGLPLDASSRSNYLRCVVDCFKLATGGVSAQCQIHTHMCYSEFKDIFVHVAELDADVLSIECSRSDLNLLTEFASIGYPLSVGPGLYDIHSPRVPTQAEMFERLTAMAKIIPVERLWSNPDCGLKTRGWTETEAALVNMVAVTKAHRLTLK